MIQFRNPSFRFDPALSNFTLLHSSSTILASVFRTWGSSSMMMVRSIFSSDFFLKLSIIDKIPKSIDVIVNQLSNTKGVL